MESIGLQKSETPRHKDRKEQLLCFLCALCGFAPLREMLLLIQHPKLTCATTIQLIITPTT
jgi:hypothetical protein